MNWADRLALGWARRYTRGLPDDDAARRRDELASDLYEHASLRSRSAAQQLEVLGRVLWGIPADLSWRRAARTPRQRRLETGEPMTLRKLTLGLNVVWMLFLVWGALGMVMNTDDPGARPFGIALLVAAALVGLGLRWRDEAPRRSTLLLAAGAVLPTITLYWMVPIFGPLAVLLIALAVTTEPGRRTPAPAV